MCVWRGRDATRVTTAAKGREVNPLAHAVAMGAADGAHEGDLGRGAAGHGDGNGVTVAVARLAVVDGVRGLGGAAHEVGRDEDLNAVLLRVRGGFGVGARDKDAAVLQQDGFGVVQAVDGRVGHDGEARVQRRGRRVQDGVEVRFARQAEAREALLGAVEDQVRPIGEGDHARDDAFGGLEGR
jgi:hypothetical protein